MPVRKHIFGSKAERKNFKKLERTWSEKLNIYHNVPFLNVFSCRKEMFDLENWTTFVISDDEYDLIKKLSIDYVVCNKNDSPLVCIEFDGLLGGINVGTKYLVEGKDVDELPRKKIMELKLRIAHGSGMPFFILGSEQFKGISDSVYLTAADGIIGEVLSTRRRQERYADGFDPSIYGHTEDEFEQLPESIKSDLIDDWAIGVEVMSDYEENPLFQKVEEMSKELKIVGHRLYFPNQEEHHNDSWFWLEIRVESNFYGVESAKVYFPDFKSPGCPFSIHIAEAICKLVAISKMRNRVRSNITKK